MKATITSHYDDGSEVEEVVCEVVFRPSGMAVSYEDDNGPVTWDGREDGPGHFTLTCEARNGRATLHMWPTDADMLEGHWAERDGTAHATGMWTIDLERE